jgi:hypothetical protein
MQRIVGATDPYEAVRQTLEGEKYNEVIVSTLSERVCRWLHLVLAHRIERFRVPLSVVTAEQGYVLIGALPGLGEAAGLYHYAPREHALERRAACSALVYEALMLEFLARAFFVGLSSIHWREAWKYGERAFRYSQHDAARHYGGSIRLRSAVEPGRT